MLLTRTADAGASRIRAPICRGPGRLGAMTACFVCLALAPPAQAGSMATVKEAVVSARNETSCAPLRYDPTVEQATEVFNRMTDDYLDHTATRVQNKDTRPGSIPDPVPGLKDLGYPATKAYLIQGAHHDDASAIKAAMLQGYAAGKFDDCSYTDFGVSMRYNERTGYNLAAVILAAP
ncbi:hypothetical protein MTER_03750 [Mycolicibacter terrae]|uniref:Secreted protein n=2 Tax=Mycolicibacter terrae TaxID=1788 RepID=A0AAD1HTN8_9MYCO|nr:hypothetical protein MTER_03750 [Mycolicibacter terrae]SNV92736.1 Uncharacterised protein [Mycolicibacter terrae]